MKKQACALVRAPVKLLSISISHLSVRLAALLVLASFMFGAVASAQETDLRVLDTRVESDRLILVVEVEAGHRHAALEVYNPAAPQTWRTMISTALDGRAATVFFRLPKGSETRALVRAKAGTSATVPVPILSGDETLCTVLYAGGDGPSERDKIALLNAANTKSMELHALERPARYAQVVAWAKTQPHVVNAKVDINGRAVLIELTDEDVVTLYAPPKPDGDPEPTGAAAASFAKPSSLIPYRISEVSAQSGTPVTTPDKGLPESKIAICANFLEADFPNSAPKIAGWLNSKGYSAQSYGLMDIYAFKALFNNPVGVLFMHAHGFPYEFKGKRYTAISLNQVTQELPEDIHYGAMRKLGELKLAKEDGSPLPPVYGFTRVFIRTHMKFAPHSLVVSDTCDGADQELADAFRDAHAGTYASWNWESGKRSNQTIEKLFDRLLGINLTPPISVPEERPFPMPVVINWMKDKGYDYDPTFKWTLGRTEARLIFYDHKSHPAYLLRPTIRNLDYSNSTTATELHLVGDFGKNPGADGKVFWGNQEMHVASWDADTGIKIDRIPSPVPVGELKVVVRGTHNSNLTPMTEWTVPFTYVVKGKGHLEYVISAQYKIRFDVHGYRDKPEQAVQYPRISPFLNHADFTGNAYASGAYFEPVGETGGVMHEWSGNRSLHSNDQAGNGTQENSLMCSAILDTQTGQTMSFFIGCLSMIDNKFDGIPVQSSIGYDFKTSSMMSLQFDKNDGWKLKGNTFIGEAPMLLHAVSAGMSWPAVTPVFAPNSLTQR